MIAKALLVALVCAATAYAGTELGEDMPFLMESASYGALDSGELSVTADAVSFSQNGEHTTLLMNDIYGATVEDDKVTVHTFESDPAENLLRVAGERTKSGKVLKEYTFTVKGSTRASEWRETILKAKAKIPMEGDVPSKRAFVMVNPRSGKGEAEKDFATVEPILKKAGFTITKHLSKAGKDTRKSVRKLKCEDFDYIVSIGGDGTLNKMIRGMFQKDDHKDCLEKWTFHAIPGGSGNGLMTNLMKESGEKFGVTEAAVLLTKADQPGYVNGVDIMAYDTTKDGNDQYGFLSTEFALAADLDKESEIFRFIGKDRFTISGIIRTLFLRRYKAKFEYLPADQELSGEGMKGSLAPLDKPVPANWKSVEGEFIMVYVCQMPWMASTALVAPDVKIGSGVASILLLPGSAGRWDVLKMLLGYSDGSHYKKVKSLQVVHGKAFRLTPLNAGTKDLPGSIGIDGDFIEPQPMQGQLNRSVVKFVYKKSE